MTKSQVTQLLPVMQAFADGKTVQMWVPDHDPGAKEPGVWVDMSCPTFSVDEQWRVKPDGPPPPREWRISFFDSHSSPLVTPLVGYHVDNESVRVREVIE